MESSVRWSGIVVKLTEEDGNAFSIIGRVRRAMKKAGCHYLEIEEFTKDATSGDYDHLLQTVMHWVNVV